MVNPLFASSSYGSKEPRIDFYKDANGKHRWRMYMSSDEVAASSQGYATKELCIDNVKKVGKNIVELERLGRIV